MKDRFPCSMSSSPFPLDFFLFFRKRRVIANIDRSVCEKKRKPFRTRRGCADANVILFAYDFTTSAFATKEKILFLGLLLIADLYFYSAGSFMRISAGSIVSILFADGHDETGVGDEVLRCGGRVVVERLRGSPVHFHLEAGRCLGRDGSDSFAQSASSVPKIQDRNQKWK